MLVTIAKLNFIDNSSTIKKFTVKELEDLEIYNRKCLLAYFNYNFNFEEEQVADFDIDLTGDICCGYNVYQFDIRHYFKCSDDFVGLEIDGKEIKSYSFPPENSYEYTLCLLGTKIKNFYSKYVDFQFNEYHPPRR